MHATPTDLPILLEVPGFVSRFARCGDLDVAVETSTGVRDPTERFRLAFHDGRCQVPHWGYLVKGRMRIKYPDHEELISAGDVWYMAPGHIPVTEGDVENVVFSPAGEYEQLMTALSRPPS